MQTDTLANAGRLGVFPKNVIWITSCWYLRPMRDVHYYRVSCPGGITEYRTIEQARKAAYEVAAALSINVVYPRALMIVEAQDNG